MSVVAVPAAATPANTASTSWKAGLRGAWLMAIQLLLYDLVFRVSSILAAPVKDSPGANPPWYFIRRDAIGGACSLVALAICLVLAVLAWKRYALYAPLLAAFSLTSFGGRAWQFLAISLYTHHRNQQDRTTARWPTFDSYLHDPLIVGGELLAYVLGLGIVILGSLAFRRARTERLPQS